MKRFTSISDRIAQYLQVAILNGLLHPGELISETRIARELGVSRTPVREALSKLEGLGLVEKVPGKYGTQISSMSLAQAREILEIRLILESAAVDIACAKVTPENMRDLDSLLERERHLLDNGELILLKEEGWNIHARLLSISGNSILAELAVQLHDRIRSLIVSSPPSEERGKQNYLDHLELVEAIKAREVGTARAIIRRHIHGVLDDLQSHSRFANDGAAEYLRSLAQRIRGNR